MKQLNIMDFGAVGDGRTLNTRAFAEALQTLREAGGGELAVPAGNYLCGAVELISDLSLRLEKGAVLTASPDIADHFTDERHLDRSLHAYFLFGRGIRNLKIAGEGVIDGNGGAYWTDEYFCGKKFGALPDDLPVTEYNVLKPKAHRPVTVYLEDSREIELNGVTLRNASCYTVWTVSCRDVRIENVTIRNLRYGPNTDALDIDCTQNVLIRNCDIDAGDDCVAIKSDPRRFGRMDACENILVEDCRLSSTTCAIRIGYEGDAPIRHLHFRNLEICHTRHGIDILSIAPVCKLRIDKGTSMEDFVFEKIRMTEVGSAIFIWAGNEPPRSTYAGHIRDLVLKDITAQAVASSFIGQETPDRITGVALENVVMHVADLPGMPPAHDFSGMPSHWGGWWKCGGLRLHRAPGVTLKDCRITCDQPDFQAVEESR